MEATAYQLRKSVSRITQLFWEKGLFLTGNFRVPGTRSGEGVGLRYKCDFWGENSRFLLKTLLKYTGEI